MRIGSLPFCLLVRIALLRVLLWKKGIMGHRAFRFVPDSPFTNHKSGAFAPLFMIDRPLSAAA